MTTANPYVTPKYAWRTPVSGDNDWYTEQASMLSCIDADLFSCSAETSAGITYVETNSAYWDSTHQTVSSNSATWVSIPISAISAFDEVEIITEGVPIGNQRSFGAKETNWTDLGQQAGEDIILSLCNVGNGVVLAGTYNGGKILRSTNYGFTWEDLGQQATQTEIRSLCYLGNEVTLAGTYNGGKVLRSTNGGVTWTDLGTPATGEQYVLNFTYAASGIVLGGTAPNGHIIRSTDEGATWADLGQQGSHGNIWWIEYLENGIVLAGTGTTAGHIYRSTDYGVTWADLGQIGSKTDVRSMVYLGSGVVLAAAYGSNPGNADNGDIYRSTDYGATWVDLNVVGDIDGIREFAYLGNGVVLVGIDPVNAANDTLFRSDDYGNTWYQEGQLATGGAGLPWSIVNLGDGTALIGTGANNDGHIWRYSFSDPVSGYIGTLERVVEANSGTWGVVESNSATWDSNPVDWPAWNDSNIGWDSGWIRPVANQSAHDRLAHGLTAEPAFAFLWAKGIGDTGEQIMTCEWDFQAGANGCRIIEMNSTNITIHGHKNTIWGTDLEATVTLTYKEPFYRVLAITKAADFDSGWMSLSATNSGTQVTVAHGLGASPDFYTLEFSDTNDGSGDRGYLMRGSRGFNGNTPTIVVDYDATNIVFSLATIQVSNYYDYNNVSQDNLVVLGQPMTGWWYKLKAWSWTPSFTSDWVGIDGFNPVVLVKHSLGKIPYLYLLEFSKASDGSDDIVPMMATDSDNQLGTGCGGDYGIHFQWIGDNYATIKFPFNTNQAANYEDSDGTFQNLDGGYVRLKLWA